MTTAGKPPVVLQVRVEYEVVWSSTLGGAGTVVERGEPNRHELVVGEVQAYLTDGVRGPPPGVDRLPLPESSRPADDADCRLSRFWDCGDDIVEAVADRAGEAWGAVGGPVLAAAQQVWSFLKGCAAFVGEVIGSVREVLSKMGELVDDPQRFVEEKVQLVLKMVSAAKQDAGGFATKVLGEMFDVELFKKNPAMWGGKLACELAVGILTGGISAAGGRLAKQLADLPGLMRKINDWLTHRNNGNDSDPDGEGKPGTCATGSFSASTPILMADGTRRSISQVRVGDLVLATDRTSGTSGARVVVATLPHVDGLLTLRTSAGVIVTTEDHRYWNATDGEWQESQHLDPGDRLLDASGGIVLVQGLDWATLRTAPAYDLTITDVHSYYVGAGDLNVLVHNCGTNPAWAALQPWRQGTRTNGDPEASAATTRRTSRTRILRSMTAEADILARRTRPQAR